MGDCLTEEQPRQTSDTPYGDAFDAFLPHYMAMGMPYELYWDSEYGVKTAYLRAYRIRMENEQRFADWKCWQMAQYLMAVAGASAIYVNGFVPKGAKLEKFPGKPFLEQAEIRKKEEDIKKKQEDQSMAAMAMFQAFVSQFNKNVEKRLERDKERGSGQ